MKTDYFDIMLRQAGCARTAAEMLVKIFNDFNPEKAREYRDNMHELEHSADGIRHEALKALSRDFITPIERDDLTRLIAILDDVIDELDEVAIELYMFCTKKLTKDALVLAGLVERCVKALESAVREFRSFKKSQTLRPLIIEVNTVESEADEAYIEAMRRLFESGEDVMQVYGLKAIYQRLENCCDLCEHVADVMESTVMDNT
ncbi:MAG: DUF47 family protein [Eubacteriales bacterium]|nr:DUF47 family protein [Eubacteriales bacterium]MDD3883100.1 DUF47 family protein [Eubacteriales bacterium]MDD4513330.1 DUF47 family protein [Eubacteriales bacterium]